MAPRRLPRIDRAVRLSRRGTTLLVVGIGGVLLAYMLGRVELLYVGLLAGLLPVCAVLFARYRRVSVEVTRTFAPPVVAVGRGGTVELAITNTSPTPTSELVWTDRVPWPDDGTATGVIPPLAARRTHVPGAGTTSVARYELVPPRRGVFDIGPLNLVLADPFGLATGSVAIGTDDSLVVTPSIESLPDTGLAILASEGASRVVRRAVGGEDDLSTREYRTGDALRRVHWRATARHGELMVRQEEPRSHAEARVVLDTRRDGYPDYVPYRRGQRAESASFELALSLAATIALHLARDGFVVELVETGAAQLEPVEPLPAFLETLATIGLSTDSGEYRPGAAMTVTPRLDRAHGSVFAILSAADAPTLDRLILQRPGFDLAVAFVVGGETPIPAERLTEAGWTCVSVPVDGSVENAWRAVAELRGARHGR